MLKICLLQDILLQLLGYVEGMGLHTPSESDKEQSVDSDAIGRAFVSAFFLHAAKRRPDGRYARFSDNQVCVHLYNVMLPVHCGYMCVAGWLCAMLLPGVYGCVWS